MDNRPKVGVCVIVVKDGKVLMQKRKGAHGEGTWSFPGGHLEFNETWEECAKRETFEEVGIFLKNLRFVAATNDIIESLSWVEWEKMPEPLFIPLINLKEQGFDFQEHLNSKIVEHYKGKKYKIIGEGKHSETQEDLVIYRALYDSEEFGKNALWIRPKKMFYEKITKDGKEVPRFQRVR